MPTPGADSVQASLRDHVCLITGASRTLGAVIARRLAGAGAHVAVNYHQSAAAAQELCAELAAQGVQARAFGADMTNPAEVARLVDEAWQHFGAIDVLINNVGPYVDTPLLDLALADFERVWAGNARATFLATQAAGRRMKTRGRGLIVNIAATDYKHRSHSIYGLAKSGVVYLTEAFALELAPEVRVNALAPDLLADNEDMPPAMAAPAIGGTPMRRLVTRDEIAEAICLLASPAFAMLTGQTIVLDGGRSIPRIAMG